MQYKAMSKKVIALVTVGTVMMSSVPAYAATVTKDETVYVNLDNKGNNVDTTVSTAIRSDEVIKNLKDKSNLTDVENVKGDEEPEMQNGYMVWNSDEKNIYYNGKSSADIPVSVSIGYELDGEPISADDIAGKSGRVKMNISFQNKAQKFVEVNGETTKMYVPFTVAGTVILPSSKFTNIELKGASKVDDGSKNIVAFAAFPGLKESLGLDDVDAINDIDVLNNNVTIEADVDNFELGSMIFAATPEIPELDGVNLDDVETVDDLKDALSQLNDGGEQLLSGAAQLLAGQKTFTENMVVFNNGMKEAQSGYSELYSGLQTVVNKYPELIAQGKQAVKGVKDLNNGAEQIAEGTKKFEAAMTDESSYKKALALKDGENALNSNIQELPDTVSSEIKSTVSKEIAAQIESLDSQIKANQEQQKDLQTKKSGLQAQKEQLEAQKQQLETQKKNLEAQKEALIQAGNQEAMEKVETGLQQTEAGLAQIETGLPQINDGINKIDLGVAQLEGANTALEAVKQQMGNMNLSMDLQNKFAELLQGSNQINAGVESLFNTLYDENDENSIINVSKRLNAGVSALCKGTEELSGKINALVSEENLNRLASKVNELSSGSSKLYEGMNALADGSGQLLDGSNQLLDGTNQLDEGVQKIQDEGINKLYTEGNEKLDDVEKLVDRKDELVNLSKQYSNYAGISEGMEGKVKFIMRTDEIKAPEVEKDTTSTENTSAEKTGFIAWIKSLFSK